MNIQTSVPLSLHTTFKIGGPAAHFVEVYTEADLVAAVAWAQERTLPLLVLGGGSNILASDDGFSGLVIKMGIKGRAATSLDERTVRLTVGAGEVFDEVVAFTVESGWGGLENLSHIPGSVGATPIQNVGAYGVEISDLVMSVSALNTISGVVEVFSNEECQFSYRDSFFKTAAGKKYIVVAVAYRLSTEPNVDCSYKDLKARFPADKNPSVAQVREAIIEIRSAKFPDWREVGTAGSFFKNPIITREHYERLLIIYPELPAFSIDEATVKIPLGYVLDKICNLRGVHAGAVGSYEGQALVIVNSGGATAADVQKFATDIAQSVLEKTNITIEWEVTKI